MVKAIIEMILRTGKVVGGAVRKTAAQEMTRMQQERAKRLADKAAEKAAGAKNETADKKPSSTPSLAALKNQMQLKEATDILDVEISSNMAKDDILAIQNKYDKMYANNKWVHGERSKPTYLQSKVYRAKERVDLELKKFGHDVDGIYASAEK